MQSMARISRLLLIAAATVACGVVPAIGASPATVEHRLGNGLRVIVKRDHRAPVAVVMLWYGVGSADEVSGTTGVAHALEHMMFKGTRDLGPGEYSRIIAEAGGRDNAFTSNDYTGYFAMLEKSHLELVLKLEADRMTNLVLSDEEWAKEIKVIMEERRFRTEDRPRGLVYETLMATALMEHPYRRPVIGWMSDLQSLTAEDARRFYRQWYTPSNAVLVVVGDVEPQEVVALVEKHFGTIKDRPLPPRKPQEEPPQRGERRVRVKAPGELPFVLMVFRVPALRDPENDWEPYALEMLSAVLSGNAAARLPRNLVQVGRIANAAFASYDGIARGPGLFYLGATPVPGKTAADVESGLRTEMARIIAEGVGADELDRAKAQAVASRVYERDSMMYQAREIGGLEMTGLSHKSVDVQLRKLQEITPEQVQEVARKYYTDDGMNVAALDPQPLEGPRPAPPEGLRHVR